MQQMGMCSTNSFSNSTFLFTSLHHGAASRCHHSNSKNIRTLFLSFPLSRPTHFTSLSVFPNFDSNKLGVSAFKKRRTGGGTLLKKDVSDRDNDNDDDEFLNFDDEFEGGDGDDEEEMFLPFEKMKKWLERKPRGFGEGKVYDTSIEDKLFEEIQQSREAQLVNVNKLKNNPVSSVFKKDDQQEKQAKDVPSGIRVRVVNLPKKKNIHRDLKAAFEGVSGIINISPAVSGNKKTRDPVCKGFAFVEFKHEADATRFLQNFSGNSIMFGKIQKQIKCEMVNSLSPGCEESRDNNSRPPKVAVSGLIGSPNVDLDVKKSLSDLSLEDISDEFDDHDDEFDMEGLGEDENNHAIGDDQDDEFDMEGLGEDGNNLNAIGDDQDDEFDTIELGEDRNNLYAIGDDQDDEFDTVELGEDRNNLNAIGDDHDDEFDTVEQGEDTINLNAIGDDQDDEFDTVELVEDRNNPNAIGESESNNGNDMEQMPKHPADSITSSRLERIRALEQRLRAKGKQQKFPKEQKDQKLERIRGVEKKPPSKGKQQKIPKEQKAQKLVVPGSAKRLKIKEKALLTDVFSKYGLKTAKES